MTAMEGTEPERTRGRALAVTTVVALVAAVLMAGAGGVLWFVQAEHDHQVRDTAVTVAARNQVLALLTLDPENVQSSLDTVLAGATGGWRQQFAGQADRFTQVVHNGQVRAQATISSSGIQKADDQRATVLVSANAMIKNTDSPDGYLGVYRVLLDLEVQDGRWLVSNLEFVA
jgi:Mce-associated membrane protein